MPTARELLEQADALMRRNRDARAAANEPVKPLAPMNGPSIAPALMSPRTIQHEPIAPSVARTSLPVDPTESPLVVPHESDADDLPVLTDAVVDDAPVDEHRDLDDVPVLTDIVEEIEMTVAPASADADADDDAVVAESARGEPSFWLDDDRGETSVLGPAPDSVVVVPPAVPVPPLEPEPGRDPLGLDQPAPGFDAPSEEVVLMPAAEPVEEGADQPVEAFVAAPAEEPDPIPSEAPPAQLQEAFAAAPLASASVPSGAAVVRTTFEQDEARVREIAEEIGMQVLQRIDIFADTTLRERLGERLKPVVERVSAELVDALNQHVGELLRVYVAEAIEREIETWRGRGSGSGE